jgi:hypothetical protein
VSHSPIFEWLSEELARRSSLTLLQSRGTIRIALDNAGVEARTLRMGPALVVVERILPRELTVRGIANAATMCTELALALRSATFTTTGPEPADTAFERLGRK